jgi:hypothetical protein
LELPASVCLANALPLSRERRFTILSSDLGALAPLVGCSGLLASPRQIDV